MVFRLAVFHAPLETFHFDPTASGTIERAPNGDDDAQSYAHFTDDRTFEILHVFCAPF
jgi:hypothetical protein